MSTDREVFSVRILPGTRAGSQWIHSHLEAHDHLAVAVDRPDGSIEIAGPMSRRTEILEVCTEISRAVGALPVTAD